MGNGTSCRDMNECELADPCYPGVRCVNLHPGYKCDPCPTGYVGPLVEGVGAEMAREQKQVCSDVNECESNNGDCDPHSECINTEVFAIKFRSARLCIRAFNVTLDSRRDPTGAAHARAATSVISEPAAIAETTSARIQRRSVTSIPIAFKCSTSTLVK